MDTSSNSTAQKPKSKGKKLLLIGLTTLGLGVLTFFSIRFWQKQKKDKASPTASAPKTKASGTSVPKPPPQSIPKPKPASKPKRTASATPPPKTAAKPNLFNSGVIAKKLRDAVLIKDFAKCFDLLKSIKNTADYTAVNKFFRLMLINGKPQTIVVALLSTFKDEKQALAIRKSFTAMGLKYDGKTWSLSGTENLPKLITTSATKVWKNPQISVPVPVNMVLGREVCKRGTFTLFENGDRYFLVESSAVKTYQPN